jgi:hypothetical protein
MYLDREQRATPEGRAQMAREVQQTYPHDATDLETAHGAHGVHYLDSVTRGPLCRVLVAGFEIGAGELVTCRTCAKMAGAKRPQRYPLKRS